MVGLEQHDFGRLCTLSKYHSTNAFLRPQHPLDCRLSQILVASVLLSGSSRAASCSPVMRASLALGSAGVALVWSVSRVLADEMASDWLLVVCSAGFSVLSYSFWACSSRLVRAGSTSLLPGTVRIAATASRKLSDVRIAS